MSIEQTITDAISNKKIIEFDYHEHHRIAEPHIYGILGGKEDLLVYQTGGTSSSGGIPEWRRMHVSEISNLRVTDQTFAGRRETPTEKRSSFDTILAVVD